jgi:hypothetical protein
MIAGNEVSAIEWLARTPPIAGDVLSANVRMGGDGV